MLSTVSTELFEILFEAEKEQVKIYYSPTISKQTRELKFASVGGYGRSESIWNSSEKKLEQKLF